MVAEAMNLHRRNILNYCFRKLGFQEVAVNTRHSTASIKTHEVILPGGRESHRHFNEIGILECHARASDRWGMGFDDVWNTSHMGKNIHDRFLLNGCLAFHLTEMFKQFIP